MYKFCTTVKTAMLGPILAPFLKCYINKNCQQKATQNIFEYLQSSTSMQTI